VLETLHNHTENLKNIEVDLRTFLHRFLFSGDEVFQSVASLSYGQRSRLMLALLVARRCNLLLLDEPLNHLDLPSQEAFETSLSSFEGTILASAHDRYFIERFARVVWHFTLGGLAAEIT
jgi:ATP-binding cassette subfamily F protein 3